MVLKELKAIVASAAVKLVGVGGGKVGGFVAGSSVPFLLQELIEIAIVKLKNAISILSLRRFLGKDLFSIICGSYGMKRISGRHLHR